MICEIPLTPEESFFAANNHDLIYTFLNKHHLSEDEFYDVIAFGYLRSVRRFFSNPHLQKYSFGTIAWKGMEGALCDYNKTKLGQMHTAEVIHINIESGNEAPFFKESLTRYNNLMTQLEMDLLLHDLAKRVSKQQMEIVRMRSSGYNLQDIAARQNTSTKRIRKLLEEVRCVLMELCQV